jgi:hypothetical protein
LAPNPAERKGMEQWAEIFMKGARELSTPESFDANLTEGLARHKRDLDSYRKEPDRSKNEAAEFAHFLRCTTETLLRMASLSKK